MHRFYRWLLPLLFAAFVVSAGGCGGGSTPKAVTRTPAQYFKEQQADTMTPHGKIMTDSVEEKDGKIQYNTTDGKQWRVTYSKRADGTYEYGMPGEVK
jgi:hypothetical protein